MNESTLDQLRRWIKDKTQGAMYGCLIARRSSVVAEWYGGDFSAEGLFEIGSIRKSFNSALIGIGIEEERVDLSARAGEWWPEIAAVSGDPADAAITLHQLASSISGWLSPRPPGEAFAYINAAFTAAERVVARMYGLPDDEIAPEVIRRFEHPLQAKSWRVYHFPRGFSRSGGNPGPKLAIDSTLRDLVKWGQLWLNRGTWEGRQLIPPRYVDLATGLVNPGIAGVLYGYNWFVNARRALWPEAPEDAYGHAGHGSFKPSGQDSWGYLWICPSLGTVAAIVADGSVGFGRDHLRVPQELTREWVGRIVELALQH